jgi:hypothetical protein
VSPPNLYADYLDSGPERDPARLLPRSAVAAARGAFLLYGLLAQGWSLVWFGAFLAAEFLLIVRLDILGDRWSGGPSRDHYPRLGKSPLGDVTGALLAIVLFYLAGAKLDAGTGALGFAHLESLAPVPGADLFSRPAWNVLIYLGSHLADLFVDLRRARSGRRIFVSASTLTASLFFGLLVVSGFCFMFLTIAGSLAGASDRWPSAVAATVVVLARSGAEIGALWFPYWGHFMAGIPSSQSRDHDNRRHPAPSEMPPLEP